jgi:hypothetical protein
MEYLEGFPSFKLTYRWHTEIDGGLFGFADSDWGNSSFRREAFATQHLALCFYTIDH